MLHCATDEVQPGLVEPVVHSLSMSLFPDHDWSGIGGEPETPFALLEHCFIASSLSEQRSQHERCKVYTHVIAAWAPLTRSMIATLASTETAHAKGHPEQDSDARGECPSYPERRRETRCEPQQEGQDQGALGAK